VHIAIDGWPLGERIKGGTSIYTLNLIKSLSQIDGYNTYTIYQPMEAQDKLTFNTNNFKVKHFPSNLLCYYSSVYRELRREKPDIFLTGLFPFTPPSTRLVLVVYTLSHILYKKCLPLFNRLVWPFITSIGLRRSYHTIVLSESTKKELQQVFAKGREASVIYLGCDSNIFKPADDASIQRVKEKYNIKGPYILYVGMLEPRKNLPDLIKAVAQLHREKGIGHKLVLGGRNGWLYGDIFRTVRELNMEDAVLVPGYIPYPDYPVMLAGADVFVYPSLHEGFGLPVLEAMACGTPVITTNTSCFSEVVGEAGSMVEPGNVSDLVKSIYEVISNPSVRQHMVEKGINRARQFTWERTARQTLQVFETVAGRN